MQNSKKCDEKIDFVITWVDGNDVKWRDQKEKYTTEIYDILYNTEELYRDWDLLKYWFRGVEKFAPFVNKIHFVTEGHLPKWLNENHPKLNIVKHSDYMPLEYLPTFSANPIELNLHRIKNLQEQFVFFNDDVFLINYVEPKDFFIDDKPVDNIYEDVIIHQGSQRMFPHIFLNCISIINRNFSKKNYIKIYENVLKDKDIQLTDFDNFLGFSSYHLASSYKKSILEEVWKEEREILSEVSKHKFRTVYDINQYLFRYWQIAKGEVAIREEKNGKYFDINNVTLNEITNIIKQQSYKQICINDTREIEDFEKTKNIIQMAFETILPNKSKFEK